MIITLKYDGGCDKSHIIVYITKQNKLTSKLLNIGSFKLLATEFHCSMHVHYFVYTSAM
jgi:hypothetical protein